MGHIMKNITRRRILVTVSCEKRVRLNNEMLPYARYLSVRQSGENNTVYIIY